MKTLKFEATPQIAFLDVTPLCNLRCSFCYDFSEEKRTKKHPEPETLLSIQNILAKNNCKGIIYLGGEPSIYPHLSEILLHGEDLGIWQTIITNGQKISDEMIQTFKKLSNFSLGLSFHDYREELYEKSTCVKGSYKRLIKTMGRVDENKIPWYTQTSVLKENYKQLYRMYEFLKEYKHLKYMDFSRMVSDGKGKNSDNFLIIEEWEDVFVTLNSIYRDGMECIIESFPLCWIQEVCSKKSLNFNVVKNLTRPCRIFISQIVLDYNGDVRICPTGGSKIANIFETDLKEIWTNNKIINHYRQVSWLENECFNSNNVPCSFFEECFGGCRRTKCDDIYSCDAYCVSPFKSKTEHPL